MGRGELTAHGFRSTFSDWAAETTGDPNHVVEAALGTRSATRWKRPIGFGDLFETRAVVMDDWAAFLHPQTGEVVLLTGKTRRAVIIKNSPGIMGTSNNSLG